MLNFTPQLVSQLDTRAILDMKWSSSSLVPILAVTTSSGQLALFSKDLSQMASAEIESQDKKPVVLSLDWNDRLLKRENDLNLLTSDSSGCVCLWSFRDSNLELTVKKKVHDFEAWITVFDAWNESIAYSGKHSKYFQLYCSFSARVRDYH